jgi:F-type H+-transporting ATPase subunit b
MIVNIERMIFILLLASLIGTLSIFSGPAFAETNAPILSLDNTNFVVSIAFFAFIAILLYLKVPAKITSILDNRGQVIRDEIDAATSILEESKTLLAELEREHKANITKAEKIVQDAEVEAKRLLADSKKEIRLSIERKIKLAEDQIRATEDSVIKSIKDRAIDKAFTHAESELTKLTKAGLGKSVIEEPLNNLEQGLKRLLK